MFARKAVQLPCERISGEDSAPRFVVLLHPEFLAVAEEQREEVPVHFMQVYSWTVVDDHNQIHHLLGHVILNRKAARALRAALDRWLGGDADAP
jgi:hypothetical protein